MIICDSNKTTVVPISKKNGKTKSSKDVGRGADEAWPAGTETTRLNNQD
jgi:hypothetical protein